MGGLMMRTSKKARAAKVTAAGREKMYRIVSKLVGEKTGERPSEVLDRMSRRALKLQRQRLARASRQSARKRSGFMPNAEAKVAAKVLS